MIQSNVLIDKFAATGCWLADRVMECLVAAYVTSGSTLVRVLLMRACISAMYCGTGLVRSYRRANALYLP